MKTSAKYKVNRTETVGGVVRTSTFKGGYLDFSHLTKLKNMYFTEIYLKKIIQIINN